MRNSFRFASALLLALMIAPATINVADENGKTAAEKAADPIKSNVHEFSEAELSAARKSLADLTPEQRALLNHLRYLMRPQYEEELMAGRAWSPCWLAPFEQPGAELDKPDLLRLWAVLASGMPVSDSTKVWLRMLIAAPVPTVLDSLGDLGLQMAVCAHGMQREELGLTTELKERADQLMDAASKARDITDDDSDLIDGKTIDPIWFANHMWRSLICRMALDMELNINERVWESALRNLLSVRNETRGWTSKTSGNSEVQDLDANLFSIAALGLAAGAPDGVIGMGLERGINEALKLAPGVLERLREEHTEAKHSGARLALIVSLDPQLAPEGLLAETWRKAIITSVLDAHDPSGMVRNSAYVGRQLGLAEGRRSLWVCETALECIALSGGLAGSSRPLANLNLADIGRAMHGCSVLHADGLPEGRRRTYSYAGGGHELPETGEIATYMLTGFDYLISMQHEDGGWGGARSGAGVQDPGTTAFVAMALLRAGHGPFEGEYQDELLSATEYVVGVVEQCAEEGPTITGPSSTQLQRKLGKIVDTAVVTQFLARVLRLTEPDRELYDRTETALDKCVRKIEQSQDEDGGWITSGWAPVLQSAMFNQALELAEVAGREVDYSVVRRSRTYLVGEVEDGDKETTSKPKKSISAGVAFYAGSSTLRATAGDAAEVSIVMEQAKKDRVLSSKATVSEANLRTIGYTKEAAAAKVAAHKQYAEMVKKLEDEKYLKGFGNNGGEEFISYMLSSESMVITGDENWDKWSEKLHDMFEKIQNKDGSWSGHHCISSPVLCTAAVLMTLTADREVHVVVETSPRDEESDRKTSSSKKKDDKKNESKGPVTGE